MTDFRPNSIIYSMALNPRLEECLIDIAPDDELITGKVYKESRRVQKKFINSNLSYDERKKINSKIGKWICQCEEKGLLIIAQVSIDYPDYLTNRMIFDIRKLLLANPGYNQLVTKDEFETKFKLDWSKIVKEYHDCDGRLPIRFDAEDEQNTNTDETPTDFENFNYQESLRSIALSQMADSSKEISIDQSSTVNNRPGAKNVSRPENRKSSFAIDKLAHVNITDHESPNTMNKALTEESVEVEDTSIVDKMRNNFKLLVVILAILVVLLGISLVLIQVLKKRK